jgi:hypothetical protein
LPSPLQNSPLYATFRSNDPSNRILIAPSRDGTDWQGGVEIRQRSGYAACQVFFKGKYWVAFVEEDKTKPPAVCSSEDGVRWSDKRRINESTQNSPALAVYNGRLWIAFIANNNLREVLICSSEDGLNWTRNLSTRQKSYPAPALAAFDGKLWVAYASPTDRQVSVSSSKDGISWSAPIHVGQATPDTPSLAVFDNKLWIASGSVEQSKSPIVSVSSNGTSWSLAVRISSVARSGPSLAVFKNQLWMSYIDNAASNPIIVRSSSNGTQWSHNIAVNQFSPFSVPLFSRLLYQTTVKLKYQIVTVVYSPPGTHGGQSGSQVDYASGSTLGNTISTSSAFKAGVGVTASVGAGPFSVGSEFSYSTTSTDSAAIDVKKDQNRSIKVTGPAKDGINHDHDIFYLWLNPQLEITIDSLNNINCELQVAGPTMTIQYVYGGWLKDPSLLPAGVRKILDNAGLTTEDYAAILATNPFTSGREGLDSDRFLLTTQSFPYIPPISPNDNVPTTTYAQQNVVTKSASHTTQAQYGVGFSVTAGISGPFTASLKVSTSFEWTNVSTSASTKTATQSAAVTIGGPAYGYEGPTDVLVYWDTVFSSFAFAFSEQAASHSGVLSDAEGNPVPFEPVSLSVAGQTLSTFTDPRGEFRFYGAPAGDGEVLVRDRSFGIHVGPGQPPSTLRL